YGRGMGSNLKINSANPDSFHYQIKLTNNTGRAIGPSYGNLATAIITVPGMPSYCGGVPCSSQIGSLGEPAFVLKGRKVAHVWPGYHDHDGDDDDDDMPVTVKYMTQSQYAANGNSCTDNPNYSSSLPSDGAPKCIKITGFSIPVRHAARIRLNFHFRLKGTDGCLPTRSSFSTRALCSARPHRSASALTFRPPRTPPAWSAPARKRRRSAGVVLIAPPPGPGLKNACFFR